MKTIKNIKQLRLFLILFMATLYCYANIPIRVCFTPGGNCTGDIISVINHAQKSIYIQAYQFTSPPIASAVVNAKNRGVDVKIILDKSQFNAKRYSSALFFNHENIPVWIDYRVNIAHNKIMIIDNNIVITGSFNFTRNAQEHNAENLLIIENSGIAAIYKQDWDYRLAASTTLASYETMPRVNHKFPHKHLKRKSKLLDIFNGG